MIKMKLVFLTQYFPPEMGAPQARIFELAVRMKQIGHEISVITAMPNYPTGNIFGEYTYKRTCREVLEGLNVLRCWIYPTKSTNVIRRLASYFSFTISSMFYAPGFLKRQDIIIVESPPLFLGISGIYLSWRCKARMIFNVSDLWPDSAIELGIIKNKIFIILSRKLESICYKKSVAITGQSPTIVETIKKRTGSRHVALITNGVDTAKFSAGLSDKSAKEKFNLKNKTVFIYAGLFGIAQGLDQILEAASLLKNESLISFLLVGDGPERSNLRKRIASENLTNVVISDPVSKSEMPILLSSMDAAIIPLKTSLTGAVPSKIYEAMASGLPIIFVGEGDGKEIIKSTETGIIVNPGNIAGLVNAIKSLHSNIKLRIQLGENGTKNCGLYSRDTIALRFNSLLQSV